MKRQIITTKDGSHTVYLPSLNEHYHSTYGAIQESMHIFINYGFRHITKKNINILEVGFGTGLNALLTIIENENLDKKINYFAIDKFPLEKDIYKNLNYCKLLSYNFSELFMLLHNSRWERKLSISRNFNLTKIRTDILMYHPEQSFDIIYFDAFAPDKQPMLWSKDVFLRMYGLLNNGGVLVTYSAKGSVKRALCSVGFKVEELPGPEGKRVVTRSVKSSL